MIDGIRRKLLTAVNKSDIDFATAVERGTKVKDRIRKFYSEVFTEEKLNEEAEYARNVMHSASTPMNHFRRGGAFSAINTNVFAIP